MPKLSLDGLPIHYQQQGKGPDVVLIHAFTSNLSIWALTGIVERLARDFRVTTYDLRGHGLSGVTPSGYTSAEMAEDFRGLHAALELKPAYLVGHSFGGVIAVQAAVDFPEIVSGVILSDTYFPGLRHLEPNMGQTEVWVDLRKQLHSVGSEIGETVDFGLLFRTLANWTPEQFDTIKQQLGAPGARWLSQLSQLASTTAGDEMFEVAGLTAERIATAAQPIVALYDEFSPFEATCNYLQQNLSNCQVDIVPGAKHLAPVQNPTAFMGLVHRHLQNMRTAATNAKQVSG